MVMQVLQLKKQWVIEWAMLCMFEFCRWEYDGTQEEAVKSIPYQLQRLFLQLQVWIAC